jgi:2',3'-cyclic-nucleotide 2'-phosphodiesterase (5'-nucleotidase family)
MVLVDAGDALFRDAAPAAAELPAAEARARLVLAEMGRMGYQALAVGERDLALGADWLAREAEAAGVPLLAANLAGPDGHAPFPASRLVLAGGRRVGVFAVLPAGALPGGLSASDPGQAARREAAALRSRGAEVVVGLFHVPAPAARQLAGELPGLDAAVAAHDGLVQGAEVRGAVLAFAVERARALGRLGMDLAPGPWADAAAPERARQELGIVERSLSVARQRSGSAATEADRAAFAELAGNFERRAERLREEAARVPVGRLFRNTLETLGPWVKEDALAARAVAELVARHGNADTAEGVPLPGR